MALSDSHSFAMGDADRLFNQAPTVHPYEELLKVFIANTQQQNPAGSSAAPSTSAAAVVAVPMSFDATTSSPLQAHTSSSVAAPAPSVKQQATQPKQLTPEKQKQTPSQKQQQQQPQPRATNDEKEMFTPGSWSRVMTRTALAVAGGVTQAFAMHNRLLPIPLPYKADYFICDDSIRMWFTHLYHKMHTITAGALKTMMKSADAILMYAQQVKLSNEPDILIDSITETVKLEMNNIDNCAVLILSAIKAEFDAPPPDDEEDAKEASVPQPQESGFRRRIRIADGVYMTVNHPVAELVENIQQRMQIWTNMILVDRFVSDTRLDGALPDDAPRLTRRNGQPLNVEEEQKWRIWCMSHPLRTMHTQWKAFVPPTSLLVKSTLGAVASIALPTIVEEVAMKYMYDQNNITVKLDPTPKYFGRDANLCMTMKQLKIDAEKVQMLPLWNRAFAQIEATYYMAGIIERLAYLVDTRQPIPSTVDLSVLSLHLRAQACMNEALGWMSFITSIQPKHTQRITEKYLAGMQYCLSQKMRGMFGGVARIEPFIIQQKLR